MVIISNDLKGNSLNRKNHVPAGMNGSSQPLKLCYLTKCIGERNIARSEQSSHTPAVATRGCNTFREKTKLLKDFIILNQVAAEKTLIKMSICVEIDRRKY